VLRNLPHGRELDNGIDDVPCKEHQLRPISPMSVDAAYRYTTIGIASGLYLSEETIGGVRYLAGWIIPTNEQIATPTPASSASASVALLSGLLNPFSPAMIGPEPEGGRGGIINEQTGALLAVPVLTNQQFSARRETVPKLGTFPMTQCQQGQC
jgi:hypothetical protein